MPSPPVTVGWRCFCGANATGNFCGNCGGRMPASKGAWQQPPGSYKGKGKGKGKWYGGSSPQYNQWPSYGVPGPSAPMGGPTPQQQQPPPPPVA
eukprot:1342342-Prorocentrum_lima.AAC.1